MQWDTWTPVFGTPSLRCCWWHISAGDPEIKQVLPPCLGNTPLHGDPSCLLQLGLKGGETSDPCEQPAGNGKTHEFVRGSKREILREHRVIILLLLERKWNIQYHCLLEMPWPRKCSPLELLFFSFFFSSCLCIALAKSTRRGNVN